MPAQAGRGQVGARRPFPSLGVFAVYTTSSTPFLEGLPADEDAATDARVVYFASAAESEHVDANDEVRVQDRLRRQRRIIGTLMGLQDFAR
jgi:hypothetical protein